MALAILAGTLMFAGCKKEKDFSSPSTYEGPTRTLTMSTESHNGTKTTVDGIDVAWESGDVIRINHPDPEDETTTQSNEFTIMTINNAGKAKILAPEGVNLLAFYPATIYTGNDNYTTTTLTSAVTVPQHYEYEVAANGKQKLALPMVGKATYEDEEITFRHICGAIDITVKNSESGSGPLYLDSIIVTSASYQLSGTLEGLDVANTRVYEGGGNMSLSPIALTNETNSKFRSVYMTFPESNCAVPASGQKVIQIPVLPFADDDITICVRGRYKDGSEQAIVGVACTKPTVRFERTNKHSSVDRAVVIKAETDMKFRSKHVLSSVYFTVNKKPFDNAVYSYITIYGSSDDRSAERDLKTKRIAISMGNLQYQASTNTWRFAPEQYEILAKNDNDNGWHGGNETPVVDRPTQSKWIDLFGWATSGWSGGGKNYQPWQTIGASTGAETNNQDYGPYGHLDQMGDLTGEYANCDWGVYNAISNGGNQPGLWHTPSREEFYSLVTDHRWASVRITVSDPLLYPHRSEHDYVEGWVLLPDIFDYPEGILPLNNGGDHDALEGTDPGVLDEDAITDGGFAQYEADVESALRRANNIYSVADWKRMEAAGAIFLPFAGIRWNNEYTGPGSYLNLLTVDQFSSWDYVNMTTMVNVNGQWVEKRGLKRYGYNPTWGDYHTTRVSQNMNNGHYKSWIFEISRGQVSFYPGERGFGRSVRLVQDCEY